ncbi:MAG: phosphate ABC transporter permease PstA [Acidimicrobiales bacterium]|nr:phosphate ABC transporter permease PstA [Acidimicrobiales bacterium]HRW36531.1 phosphate ABC transporter permease PstA [Aquihabitans sp.]
MTATTAADRSVAERLTVPSDVRVSTIKGGRFVRDRIATIAMIAAFVAAAIPLVFVIGNVVARGASVVTPSFLTSDIPTTASASELKGDCELRQRYDPTAVCEEAAAPAVKPGMGPAVIGTLITTAVAALLAIPLGILAAIYLHEYGKRTRLARFIRFMSDVMTGVPSIVMGIFIYTLWVLQLGAGRSALAASLALACLMLPIVVRSSEEMLRLVPNTLREASAGLGARTWKTTLRVVLPAALPGLVSGSMLAVARAAGETAPVLFTIGAATTVARATTLTGQSTTLSFQIYNLITNGGKLSPQMAWGAALTLIAIVLILTTIARTVSQRFTMR